MMETRLHPKAVDTAMLRGDDKLSPVAIITAEDAGEPETVDFAATLQGLIDSNHQKTSHTTSESSVAVDPSSPDEANPRTAASTTSIAGSERPINQAWARILSGDEIYTAANPAYASTRNPEAVRAYQPRTFSVESLSAATNSATQSSEPRDQSSSSGTQPNSVATTGHSTPVPRSA